MPNDEWRRKHAEAHARYGNLKDRIDRTEVDGPGWERLDRELDEAEAELRALAKVRTDILG